MGSVLPAGRNTAPRGSAGNSGLLLSPGDFDSRKLVLFPVCQISKELRLHIAVGGYHARVCLREEERSIQICKTRVFSSH
ncbi:unnamed protein product [Bubo scandiacus]